MEKQCEKVISALFKVDEEYTLLKESNEVYDNERDVIDWAYHITALQRIITNRIALHDHKEELRDLKFTAKHKPISIIMTNKGEIISLATNDLNLTSDYIPILEVDYWDEADHMLKYISEKVQLLIDNNSGYSVCVKCKDLSNTKHISWKDYDPHIHFLIARGDDNYISQICSEEDGLESNEKYKVICQSINGTPNIYISDYQPHKNRGTILTTHSTIREANYSKALYKYRLNRYGENPLAM